ncbi:MULTISPECIES: amidohydrolase family protein [unclassified Nitrobacter]|uniref:metal-dependent hydrolase family protein n=1 Tax=unclassified Nitrobacter TaxID=2620411 RepID=UPI000929B5A5|nr:MULTISPECIES: amidohydrolase family protein [unclassified Nitrobacter]MBN9148833.1 amidohydrolase family protein [Nitrobacter sp.]OJV02641.1 MAG: hydrolase [Nitrobacter sp. 62-23]
MLNKLRIHHFCRAALVLSAFLALSPVPAVAQQPVAETIFRNVRVLDVVDGRLGPPTSVVIRGNTIAAIGPSADVADSKAEIIDGKGRTLMPGLIDVHVHLTFGAVLLSDLYDPKTTAEQLGAAAAKSATDMLLRGFTAVRDMGGPIFPLKRAIDSGKVRGPRIWPSGAIISQTSGHGDFRTPDERSRRFFGKPSRAEEEGATFIADGRDEVLAATRENLRMGASQIKIMGGGGTSSAYDPIDVTQYTLDEMKAAVDAASDWNTYVAVHAYTPRAVRRAMEAGVRCIEHGQLLDEPTVKLMAQKGIWLSAQNLIADSPNMTAERRAKRKGIVEGNARIWPLAKKYGVKLAWGTDILFEPELNAEQNRLILSLKQWFSPAEILRLVTYDNAQLLALSGPRAPYPGRLGVVQVGALADLLLVDGDPLSNIDLLADPQKNFQVIMKDGVIYKND